MCFQSSRRAPSILYFAFACLQAPIDGSQRPLMRQANFAGVDNSESSSGALVGTAPEASTQLINEEVNGKLARLMKGDIAIRSNAPSRNDSQPLAHTMDVSPRNKLADEYASPSLEIDKTWLRRAGLDTAKTGISDSADRSILWQLGGGNSTTYGNLQEIPHFNETSAWGAWPPSLKDSVKPKFGRIKSVEIRRDSSLRSDQIGSSMMEDRMHSPIAYAQPAARETPSTLVLLTKALLNLASMVGLVVVVLGANVSGCWLCHQRAVGASPECTTRDKFVEMNSDCDHGSEHKSVAHSKCFGRVLSALPMLTMTTALAVWVATHDATVWIGFAAKHTYECCEAIRINQLVRAPANAWSSISFFYSSGWLSLRIVALWPPLPDRMASFAMAAAFAFSGFASFFNHAAVAWEFVFLDMVAQVTAMGCWICCVVQFVVAPHGVFPSRRWALPATCWAGLALLVTGLLYNGDSGTFYINYMNRVFGIFFFTAFAMSFVVLKCAPSVVSRWEMLAAVGFIIFGQSMKLILDDTNGIKGYCLPHSLFQITALFHIMVGIAVYYCAKVVHSALGACQMEDPCHDEGLSLLWHDTEFVRRCQAHCLNAVMILAIAISLGHLQAKANGPTEPGLFGIPRDPMNAGDDTYHSFTGKLPLLILLIFVLQAVRAAGAKLGANDVKLIIGINAIHLIILMGTCAIVPFIWTLCTWCFGRFSRRYGLSIEWVALAHFALLWFVTRTPWSELLNSYWLGFGMAASLNWSTVGPMQLCMRQLSYYVDLRAGQLDSNDAGSSLWDFVAYSLYYPLYLTGPVMSYTDFSTQLATRKAPNLQAIGEYAWELVSILLYIEFLRYVWMPSSIVLQYVTCETHCFGLSSFQFLAIMHSLVTFTWGKFAIVWKFYRLWSLLDGMDPPENIPFTIDFLFFEVTSIASFWRRWHASANLWLVKYIYIPLGGKQAKLKAMSACFAVMVFFHDTRFANIQRYLPWMCIGIAGIMLEDVIPQKPWLMSLFRFFIAVMLLEIMNVIAFGYSSLSTFAKVVQLISVENLMWTAVTSAFWVAWFLAAGHVNLQKAFEDRAKKDATHGETTKHKSYAAS